MITEEGTPPADDVAALVTARLRLADAPVLVPVHGHRHLPAGRGNFGRPVPSMRQTDVIHYGPGPVDRMHQGSAGHVAMPAQHQAVPSWLAVTSRPKSSGL